MDKLECVTSFIDIGRGDWGNGYSRSSEKYLDNFIKFYSTVELKITVFCNQKIKDVLTEKINNVKDFKSEVNFEIIDKKDLKYFDDIEKIQTIQSSTKMVEYTRRDKSNPPEYSVPEYVAMMFAKTEILKIAENRGVIKSDNVAWIDFGIGHGIDSYIERVKGKKLINPNSGKIIMFNRQNIDVNEDPFFYSKMGDNVLICGGFYIVPKSLIDSFYVKFKEIVENLMYKNDIVDDDQTIMSIFASKNRGLVDIKSSSKYRNNPSGGDWFPVFDFLM